MRLSKATIENFRGIKNLEIEFDRDITVLIGENNSGKSSIIEALRLCLDAIKSDKACNFNDFDFYRDEKWKDIHTCEPIKLTLSFLETEDHKWTAPITQGLNDVIVGDEYSSIKLQVSAKYDEDAGEIVQTLSFLDDAGNVMVGKKDVVRELRKLRPFFFLSALRDAKDQFSGKSTFWASFLKNKDIDDPTRQTLEDELFDIITKIVNAHASFKDVTEEVKRISELVAVGKTESVSVDPVSIDIYKMLQYNTEVNLMTTTNAKIPIRSHGEGTQSLSVLLLFSAFLKTRLKTDVDKHAEPIIAIEEPETHLHPNAIRLVWKILNDLPGQKIISTHSGDVLSEIPLHNLRMIQRKNAHTECKLIISDQLDDDDLRKINHHIRRSRGELLFARKWLLVEGETDVSVFTECAELLGVNLYKYGVRVVEYSQVGIKVFIKVADFLGIKWFLVADGDNAGEKDYIKPAKRLRGFNSQAQQRR